LLNALEEEDRLEEAEELWTKLFSKHLESMPRIFFDKMIGIYYGRGMHDKMFDVCPFSPCQFLIIGFLFAVMLLLDLWSFRTPIAQDLLAVRSMLLYSISTCMPGNN